MANTISYKDLKNDYLNDTSRDIATRLFGDTQPNICIIGHYSAPSWNWAYQIGIVAVMGRLILNDGTELPTQPLASVPYMVCTQFGKVIGARLTTIPTVDTSC